MDKKETLLNDVGHIYYACIPTSTCYEIDRALIYISTKKLNKKIIFGQRLLQIKRFRFRYKQFQNILAMKCSIVIIYGNDVK